MKKFILSIVIVLAIITLNKDKIVIPKESIRLRVIANSNSEEDQNIKYKVKEDLENELFNILSEADNIDEARIKINQNLSSITNTVNNTLISNNYLEKFSINYGLNYFPKKEYKSVLYNEGLYESVVVTLGEGNGDNWWCVLFPPFCLIEAENSDKVEYTWKIKEIIDKYF